MNISNRIFKTLWLMVYGYYKKLIAKKNNDNLNKINKITKKINWIHDETKNEIKKKTK